MKRFILAIISLVLLSGCVTTTPPLPPTEKQDAAEEKEGIKIEIQKPEEEEEVTEEEPVKPEPSKRAAIPQPIENALARITKKPFGIKVSPDDSPVTPEKFSGYHTGADFEVLEGEQEAEVDIFAICKGQLIMKKRVAGYGGVAVQRCALKGQEVTVLYGHLNAGSITAEVKDILGAGEKIGILGEGYSQETDGERKHLHLGIHKGKPIVLLGYVQDETLLNGWIDPAELFR